MVMIPQIKLISRCFSDLIERIARIGQSQKGPFFGNQLKFQTKFIISRCNVLKVKVQCHIILQIDTISRQDKFCLSDKLPSVGKDTATRSLENTREHHNILDIGYIL